MTARSSAVFQGQDPNNYLRVKRSREKKSHAPAIWEFFVEGSGEALFTQRTYSFDK